MQAQVYSWLKSSSLGYQTLSCANTH